jgi:hypothetical protein
MAAICHADDRGNEMENETSEDDWPDVLFLNSEIRDSPQWSLLREVVPIFSRRPYEDWCLLFTEKCENDGNLEWHEAGFARCKPEQTDEVSARFAANTIAANIDFRAFLGRGLLNDDAPHISRQFRDLIKLEEMLAASGPDDGARCGPV